MNDQPFAHQRYMIRKKIFKFLGQAFHIYGPDGQVVFYSKLKVLKLKEDVRLYSGEDMADELLAIKARQVLDISATYDVVDARTQEKVGAIKRKGLKSFIRDEWVVLDPSDRPIGEIKEDSTVMALLRRFLSNLIPQNFDGVVNGQPVFAFKRHFNPFVLRMDMDFTPDRDGLLDRRLGIAAAVLLTAIEGRQG